MADTTLPPAVALGVDLDAICARGQYTADPAPVIAELREAAGDRMDVLAKAVGVWVGFNSDVAETAVLRDAMRAAFPDCEQWVPVGEDRRARTRLNPAINVSTEPRHWERING